VVKNLSMQPVVLESTRTLTPDEFEAWDGLRQSLGDRHQTELLNGRVVMGPPAAYPHGEIELNLGSLLRDFVRAGRLGRAFGSSQGYTLPTGDVVQPDLSFVSNARWPKAPPPEAGRFLRLVPDVIFEILSDRTASYDRGAKREIYERNGVREYWLVDFPMRELMRFSLGSDGHFERETVFRDGAQAVSLALDGFVLDPALVFPSP
jgi:Uma2 family endonuclease